LRKGLQESFLGRFFGVTAIAKKSVRNVENPRAVAAHNFRKRTLVFRAGLARQFEIGGLFVTVRQKRSLMQVCQNRER
jgi:hypothetical protein